MSTNTVSAYEKTVKGIASVLDTVAILLLLAMMLLGTADVIGRYIFSRAIIGTMEMSEVFLASMSMLGLAGTQLLKGHIFVDLFTGRMSPRSKAATYFTTTFISFVIFALIAWRSVLQSLTYSNSGRLVVTVLWPLGPIHYLVTIGSVVLCLVFILDMMQYARQMKGGK